MRAFTKFIAAAAVVASTAAFAVPASAVTFANFTQVGTAKTIHWVRDANTGTGALDGTLFTGTGTVGNDNATPGSIAIRFNFQLDQLADFNNLNAVLTVNAREVGNVASFTGAPDNVVTQTGIDGNTESTGFSIIYTGPNTTLNGYEVNTGANLLSAKFTNIWIQGVRVANAGAASDSDPTPGTITFTSDFLNFGTTVQRGLSWDLTSIAPVLGFQAGKALPSFSASIAGSFSAEGIPEPMTWALMIMGFGAAGAMLRRRRALALA
jgi:hypothetical protein